MRTVAQELWYSHWWTWRSEYSRLSGTLGAFAADGGEQSGADIEVQGVAELVKSRASWWKPRPERRWRDQWAVGMKLLRPSEPSRSLSVLKPRKSSDLSVTSNLTWVSGAGPAPPAPGPWLLDGDLAFVHHLLDEVVEQLLHLLRRHVLQALHHFLEVSIIGWRFERLKDSLLEVVERVLVPLAGEAALSRNRPAPIDRCRQSRSLRRCT